jgi:threonine/homoserine/homoserine lactone efflux protein
MHIDVILYVLLIDFLAILSPGPDFFMVIRNSMSGSLKTGIYTTIGISLGSMIVFSLGIFGVGAIVANSKLLFNIIKIAGSLYLAYLGLKSLWARTYIVEPQLAYAEREKNPSQYFRIGLVCNLTNPKALMFITALSTYVAEHGNPYFDGIVIIVGSTVATFLWFVLVSMLFSRMRIRQIFYKKQRIINIVFGCILLYVAYKIMFFK